MTAPILAYIDLGADMASRCPNCHMPPNEYCRRPDGHLRRTPCIARIPHDAHPYAELITEIDRTGRARAPLG